MHTNFITEDQTSLKRFLGMATKKPILINTHQDKFILLKTLSATEWSEMGRKFYLSLLTRSLKDYENFEEKKGLLRIFGCDSEKACAFHYLKADWLKSVIENRIGYPVSSYKVILDYLLTLNENQQIELWQSIRPRTKVEYENALRSRFFKEGELNALNLEELTLHYDFQECINLMINLLAYPSFGRKGLNFSDHDKKFVTSVGFKQKILEFLVYLQSKDYLLFSIGAYLKLLKNNQRNGKGTNTGRLTPVIKESEFITRDVKQLIQSTSNERRDSSEVKRDCAIYAGWFLMSTSIKDIGDLSTEILEAALRFNVSRYGWFDNFIHIFNEDKRYKAIKFPQPRRFNKNEKKSTAKARSFEWALDKFPHLEKWCDLMNKYIQSRYVTYTVGMYMQASYFLEYLATLEYAPLPDNLDREIHIRGINTTKKFITFRDFLDNWIAQTGRTKGEPLGPESKASKMHFIRNLMQFHCEENIRLISESPELASILMTTNPIKEMDCEWKSFKSATTHRTALKQEYLDLATEIILSPDVNGIPTFNWVRNHPGLSNDWILINNRVETDWRWTRVHNLQKQIWQPSRVLALYTILELGLRGFQARWLDSGMADEFYWNFSNNSFEKNHSDLAIKGRQLGVFQPLPSGFLNDESTLGFYVSTNKNQIWNLQDFKGLLIPWPYETLYNNIQLQRDFIILVSEMFHTTSVRLSDQSLDISPKVKDLLPSFNPLFRDLSRTNGNNLPISSSKINYLWVLVCEEMENRLLKKGINIKLVNKNKRRSTAVYDRHSIRVSRFTSLIKSGIPLEDISEFIAGHRSLAMTLRYNKQNPLEVRKKILAIQEENKKLLDAGVLDKLFELLEGKSNLTSQEVMNLVGTDIYKRFLIKNNPANNLNESYVTDIQPSQWTIQIDGICPGTSCESGVIDNQSLKAGVRRCGNCKFFITGTAFLYGQAHKCNLILFEMKNLGKEQFFWRAAKRESNPGETKYEESMNRLVEIEDKLEGLITDWWGRYKLFKMCLDLINEKKDEGDNRLITYGNDQDFKFTISNTNHLEFVKEIAQSTEILSVDIGNKGPENELKEIMNVILSESGVKPFLLGLPKENSLRITNLVAEAMVAIFQTHNEGNETLAYEQMLDIAEKQKGVEIAPRVKASLQRLASVFEGDNNIEIKFKSLENLLINTTQKGVKNDIQ